MNTVGDAVIRPARAEDVGDMVGLAQARRLDYQAAQPRFWRVAEDAVEKHTAYLASLVDRPAGV